MYTALPRSTMNLEDIQSGELLLRLNILESSIVVTGTNRTSPHTLMTTMKFNPSSLIFTVSSPIRTQSPTPNGLVENIMISARNIVAAVEPKTKAKASSADDTTV